MKVQLSMRFLLILCLFIVFLLLSCSKPPHPTKKTINKTNKRFDLVLIHGLANKHKWSDNFLETCLEIWGSGRVFVVYTGAETGVDEKDVNGRILIVGGGNGINAGIDSIDTQVTNLSETIQTLQAEYRLHSRFSIIAHSMGGLVARKYIFENPGTVAGLVTIGTPHHGSPLANSFQWVGYFLNATNAIEDLKPENVALFNKKYPAENTPLAVNKRIYSIRGLPDGTDCFGWAGELLLGWQILSTIYGMESDGLVPYNSAVIKGTEHIADFPHYDHYDLVRKSDVARTAAEYLP